MLEGLLKYFLGMYCSLIFAYFGHFLIVQPSFRHLVSFVYQVSGSSLKQIDHAQCLKTWAQPVPLTVCTVYTTVRPSAPGVRSLPNMILSQFFKDFIPLWTSIVRLLLQACDGVCCGSSVVEHDVLGLLQAAAVTVHSMSVNEHNMLHNSCTHKQTSHIIIRTGNL